MLINKIDRKDADIEKTEHAIHDLFLDLAADDSHLDFPVLYGSSRNGYASMDSSLRAGDMKPLFEAIIKNVPAPIEKEEQSTIISHQLRSLRLFRTDCSWPYI